MLILTLTSLPCVARAGQQLTTTVVLGALKAPDLAYVCNGRACSSPQSLVSAWAAFHGLHLALQKVADRCPETWVQNLEDLPKPHKDGLVKLKQQPERFYASVSFSGAVGCGNRQCGTQQLLRGPRPRM